MLTKIKKVFKKTVDKFLYEGPRRNEIDRLPDVVLREDHFKGCELLADRETLLQRVGSIGCAAELGVNRGEFSELIMRHCTPNVLHLVDIWNTERYHDGLFGEVSEKFGEDISNGDVVIHRKLSTEAASDFDPASIDFLYIDTDHSYATTRDELLSYEDKMKPSGIIAGHDFSVGNWITGFKYGVIEAVYEFCSNRNWRFEYITMNRSEGVSFALRKIENLEG